MKNKKTLYLLSPRIKWSTYKKLNDKLVTPDSGPTPVGLDKILWEMLREKKIYLGYRSDMQGDMWVGLEVPKGFQVTIIS